MVRDLLARYDIDFEAIDVDNLENHQQYRVLEKVRQYNDRVSFPTTVIDDDVIVGYKADQIKKALRQK